MVNHNKKIKSILTDDFNHQIENIERNKSILNEQLCDIVTKIYECKGKLVITGVGKNAIISKKIVSTLISTKQNAYYLHGNDAVHGDLGVINEDDIVMLISKSGNTYEIKKIINFLKKKNIPTIALTSNSRSFLALESNFKCIYNIKKESSAGNIAPTTSLITCQLIGDAIAVALMNLRNFSAKDFSEVHPSGALGLKLNKAVSEIFLKKTQVCTNDNVFDVILEITKSRLGATVVTEQERVVGIITDGDLRRTFQSNKKFEEMSAKDIMTRNPITIAESLNVKESLEIMNEKKIMHLVVIRDSNYLGLLHMHDLIDLGKND